MVQYVKYTGVGWRNIAIHNSIKCEQKKLHAKYIGNMIIFCRCYTEKNYEIKILIYESFVKALKKLTLKLFLKRALKTFWL